MNVLRFPAPLFLMTVLAGCGTLGGDVPEGFSSREWQEVQKGSTVMAQGHRWIDRSAARRKQRDLAVLACFEAYALSRADAENLLQDIAARKRYYRQINTTWLPELAVRAQRGEGGFGELLAQHLEEEAKACWNPKSVEALRAAAGRLRKL